METFNEMFNSFEYKKSHLKEICEKKGIRQRHIMTLFNQTNSNTVSRWLRGFPIYFDSLLKICNQFCVDILQFITYKGRSFETNLEDLYRFEISGYNLREVMREKGITPAFNPEAKETIITKAGLTAIDKNGIPGRVYYEYQDACKKQMTEAVNAYNALEAISLTALTDIIVKVQSQCFEHELNALKKQREEMQATIDEKNYTIAELRVRTSNFSQSVG